MDYFRLNTRFICLVIAVLIQLDSIQESKATTFSAKVIKSYRERVARMFEHAYNGYLKHAYPYDELRPLTCDGHDTWGSYSLTLIDALDTLAILGNYTEFQRVAELLASTLDFDRDINVSVFETNIRVVGGLLSAHLLSHHVGMELEPGWPCSGPLLRLSEKIARKLLPAFDTPTGMPYGTVNLMYGVPEKETTVTCTAGVGTFIVEFGALTRLTGDPVFERVALRALDALWEARSSIGLVGNHIDVKTGKWTAVDSGIGAGVDSYFEYLIKGSVLFQYPQLQKMFKEYHSNIELYLKREDWFMWANMKKGTITLPVFQSLEAFWPGALSMVGELDKAMKTIHNYHQVWRQYGFTPEFYNIPKADTHSGREGYPLRPELIESAMYLYRATGDPYLLQIGVDILESIEHNTKTQCGYATVHDVRNHKLANQMESFFLAETTKYLYLLFAPDHWIHSTGDQATVVDTPNGQCFINTGGYVFNTEAHPVDPAALYCCSVEKERDELQLNDLHSNIDLMALLDLTDWEQDPFQTQTSNIKKGFHLKNNHHVVYDDTFLADSLYSQGRDARSQESQEKHVDIKGANLEKVMMSHPQKYKGGGVKVTSVIVDKAEDSKEEVKASTMQEPSESFSEQSSESETCEAVEVKEYNSLLDSFEDTGNGHFPARLFTCPAQPFHMRMSLMGEMFVDK